MPPIRQATASPLQATGSTGPRASALSFGANAGGLAQGLGQAAGALESVAASRQARDREASEFARAEALESKAEYEGEQSLRQREAQADLGRAFSEWGKDNPDATAEEARKAFQGFQSDAAKARDLDDRFAREFEAVTAGHVEDAVAQHEAAQVKRSREAAGLRIDQFSKSAIQEYSGGGQFSDDSGWLVAQSAEIFNSIDRRFPNNPVMVEELKTKAAFDIANAMVGRDPEAAIEYIDNSSHIEPSDRKALIQSAQRSAKQADAAAVIELGRTMKNNFERAINGREPVPIPEDAFVSESQKAQYEYNLGVHSEARSMIVGNAGVNKIRINQMKELRAKSKSNRERDAAELAIENLEDKAKLIDDDAVSYLMSGNPTVVGLRNDVAAAWDAARDSEDPALFEAARQKSTDLNDEMLRLQGYGDSDYNLNKSPHLFSLMENPRAEEYKDRILGAKSEDVLQVWAELEAQYPNPDHLDIAFEDIASQGLDFAHIASYYFRNEPWVETFIEAQRMTDDERRLLPEADRAKFEGAMQGHPAFVAFLQANIDGGANSKYAASILGASIKYAHKIQVGSKGSKQAYSMEEAVEVASENMFGRALIVDTGDGLIDLEAFDSSGHGLSEDDITQIEGFLPVAISSLDKTRIGDRHFRSLTGVFDPKRKQQFIDDVINEAGNVRLAVDRDRRSIIMIGREMPGGSEFVVEDHDGNPFRIHLDDLPRRAVGKQRKPGQHLWLEPSRSERFPKRSNWPFSESAHGVPDADLIFDLDI